MPGAHQPGHRACIEAAKLRAGLEVEANPRELIRDYLVQRVEHGVVRSRADVVDALKEGGTRSAAPGQPLRDRPRPEEREPLAAEGSVVRA